MRTKTPSVDAEAEGKQLQETLNLSFPDLTVSTADSKIHVRGSFPVTHEGRVLDRYQIEIVWTASDIEVPTLLETGGRIPWIADRHMSRGGNACALVPEEWLIKPRDQRTLIQYLEGPVRNYFLWQSLYESGLEAPWGERKHGVPGLLQAYGDLVGFSEENAIRECLDYLSKDKLKGHWRCPCGSNLRLRDCHLSYLRDLRTKVPQYIAKLALKRLRNPVVR